MMLNYIRFRENGRHQSLVAMYISLLNNVYEIIEKETERRSDAPVYQFRLV